ncbi:unnamed protein product, partial [marine sediment metagenome]
VEQEQAHEADLFIYYDHGSETGLVAQGGLGYMVDMWNVDLLKGADVYTMCCSAAADLGKTAFRKGVKTWWGYDRPFSFILEMEDTFCKLANLGMKIKRGSDCSWCEAAVQVRLAYDDEIKTLQDNNGNPWAIISLVNDRDCLVVWCEANPPDTDCTFRGMGIKIFGMAGHKITRLFALASAMGLIGYGVALHDFSHQVWELKGTPISLEGGYVGFLIMFLANMIAMNEYIKSLR